MCQRNEDFVYANIVIVTKMSSFPERVCCWLDISAFCVNFFLFFGNGFMKTASHRITHDHALISLQKTNKYVSWKKSEITNTNLIRKGTASLASSIKFNDTHKKIYPFESQQQLYLGEFSLFLILHFQGSPVSL